MTLIDQIKESELAYIKEFTEYKEFDTHIVFTDSKLPGMDHHNFTYIKENLSQDALKSCIDSEIKRRLSENYTSGFFIADFKMDPSLFEDYAYDKEFLEFIYMATSTNTASKLNPRQDLDIKLADTPKILEDGIAVDIEANTIYMGDFAKDRIHRKATIYKNNQLRTSLYVGYYKNIAIGNCELFPYETICKLEDFDILEAYQKQGFGTRFLQYLLRETEAKGIHTLYLVTDKSDTAQDMYKKNHFVTIGEKYEVYIDFNKPK